MHLRVLVVVALCWAFVGCDEPTDPGIDAGGADAATMDGGRLDAARIDAGPRADAGPVDDFVRDGGPPVPWPDSRGWRYVRDNPMFISALTVRMGAPPEHAVNRYFDDFGANSVHLWETALPTELDGWLAHRPAAPWLTWLHADGTVVGTGQVAGGYAANAPGRIGYQIGDEPVTTADMDEVLSGMAAIAAHDPDGLRVVNFSFTRAENIDDFTQRFCASGLGDVASYDLYSRANRHYEVLAYFRDLGLRCGMPYWRYIKAYIATGSGEEIQTESDMRWAAFVGLTYGYTGHTWFLYFVGGGDAEGIPSTLFTETENWSSATTERFTWAAQLNREMAVYGRALTQLVSRDIGWAAGTTVAGAHPPEGAPSFAPGQDPYLRDVELEGRFDDALLGFFQDEAGDRYVIVQNPNHSDGSFPTDGDDPLVATLRFDFSSAPSNVDRGQLQVLDGRAGTVAARALTGGGLDINLAAGDILFFKYDTGRPFAGF